MDILLGNLILMPDSLRKKRRIFPRQIHSDPPIELFKNVIQSFAQFSINGIFDYEERVPNESEEFTMNDLVVRGVPHD